MESFYSANVKFQLDSDSVSLKLIFREIDFCKSSYCLVRREGAYLFSVVAISDIYFYLRLFDKNFVKATFLLKKLLKR